jgi:AcrR family transcriptional regulator
MTSSSNLKLAARKGGSRAPLPPRERIVRSAAQLIRRHGVSGTGMREIVIAADAPRGSLQHYFPGGKEGLVGEALLWMGGVATRRVQRHLAQLEPATPRALLAALVDDWRADLTDESFVAGCPLVAAAGDVLATSEELGRVLRQAFGGWQDALTEALVELDVPADRAERLAIMVISALEGAIVLARIRGDLTPLDVVVSELGPLLDDNRSVRSGA